MGSRAGKQFVLVFEKRFLLTKAIWNAGERLLQKITKQCNDLEKNFVGLEEWIEKYAIFSVLRTMPIGL